LTLDGALSEVVRVADGVLSADEVHPTIRSTRAIIIDPTSRAGVGSEC
jgi:hypothetical protein